MSNAAGFTDVDMMILAKLAYVDVPANSFNSDGTAINNGVSLNDFIAEGSSARNRLVKEFGSELVNDFCEKIDGKEYNIVKSVNEEYGSGLQAIAIEGPDKGTVTVAARGSESETFLDTAQDWVNADFVGLGIQSESWQHDQMSAFMNGLEQYDSIYLTGHSLGGNLAVHGAVSFSEPEKIKGVCTYNSPGQNAAYVDTHATGILNVSGKITNYQNEDDYVSDINLIIGEKKIVAANDGDANGHMLSRLSVSSDGTFISGDKGAGHFWTSLGVNALTAVTSGAYLLSGLGLVDVLFNFEEGFQKASNWVANGLVSAGEWIGNAYDDAKEWVGEAVDDIKDGAKAVGKAIAEGTEEVGEAIVDGAKAVGSGIAKGAKAVGDGISNAYEYVTGTGRYNSDLIFVNTEGLREEASKMRNYQQEYTNVMQKITNLIITLKQNNIWDAPATTTFIDNYIELKEVFDKFGRVMTEYSSILEGVSERMQTTDNTMSAKFENLSL